MSGGELERRARLFEYARFCGARIEEQTGEVARAKFPDWSSVLDWCSYSALDAAESDTRLVSLALELASPERVLAWVQKHIEWRDEPGERLSSPSSTLARGWGDCDDSATLLCALFCVLGLPAGVVGLSLNGEPVHAACAVQIDGAWWWADGSENGGLEAWRRHPLERDARPGARGIVRPSIVRVPAWP